MYALFRQTLNDFKQTYDKHLAVELFFKLLTSFLMIPVFSFLFDKMIRMLGSGLLINREVYKIGLSLTGWSFLILIGILFVMIVFIELGAIIVVAQKTYFQRKVALADALFTALKTAPKLLGFGMIPFIFFILLLLPLTDSPFFQPIRESFNLPIFIQTQLYYPYVLALFYVAVVWLILYTIVRWVFTLHFIMIEHQSVVKAIRSSIRLTRQNKSKTLVHLLVFNIAVVLLGLTLLYVISIISSLLEAFAVIHVVQRYLTVLYSFLTLLFTMVAIPLNIIYITRLFYQFQKQDGEVDQLVLHRTKWLSQLESRMRERFATKRSLLSFTLALCFMAMLVLNFSLSDNLTYVRWHMAVVGHRGDLRQAPENTIASIRSAIDKGVDVVEVDVQMTKDGVVVLHHDPSLMRMAGVPYRVADLTYEELSSYDIGGRFDAQFAGETIPTLQAVLEDIEEDHEVRLLVEIKPHPLYADIVDEVVTIVEAYEFEDRVLIQSLDYNVVQHVRQINPNIKIGQILFLKAGNLAELDVDFYAISLNLLSKSFVKDAHKLHRQVWVWTVNSERDMKDVLKYNIDAIITDFPERLQSIVNVRRD